MPIGATPDPTALLRWLAGVSSELRRSRVGHALAGGLAVAVWGQPRATVDVDLVIASREDELDEVRAAGARAGLLQTRARPTRFQRITLLRMLAPPDRSGEPIAVDLLIVPERLSRDVIARAREIAIAGARIPVASPEDTILLKLLRCSGQDRVDIAAIASARRLDRRYLEAGARRLRVLSRLPPKLRPKR